MRKKVATIAEVMVLVILISGLFLIFVGCDKTPIEPVFEIKLYDDNWEELPKRESGIGYESPYRVEYDGNQKGFNVKCFMDGEEFYTYEYLNPDEKQTLSINVQCSDDKHSYLRERCKYTIKYSFNKFADNHIYYTKSGKSCRQKDLSRNVIVVIGLLIY